jgi:hypothetical protein
MNDEERPAGAHPHEGRELELMLAGLKPLAMFDEIIILHGSPPPEYELKRVPEADFAPFVANGTLVRREIDAVLKSTWDPDGKFLLQHVFFALPAHAWRIDAMIFLLEEYLKLESSWDATMERLIGRLLGYSDGEIGSFIVHMEALRQVDEARPPA